MSAERKEGHCYISISGRVPAGSANRFMKLEPSLARIWRCLSELLSIKEHPSHTLHCTMLLRQHGSFPPPRLIKPCCQEKRLRESLLTFSVRLFITSFFDNVTFHRQDIPVSHVRHPSVPWVFTCQRQECSPMFLYLPPNFNINRITGIRQK